MAAKTDVPIQPVDKPILCHPYKEPTDYWKYDTITGVKFRRPAAAT